MQGPTYISSDIVAQKEAEFPAMTVCPESTKYKENVLQEHGIATEKGYNYKGQAHDMFSRIFRIRIYEFFLPNIMLHLF